jgi:Stigma-specific protein, Stig1
MDERRFDALTRTLAAGSTRRTIVRGLIASIPGSLFLKRASRDALAQPTDCSMLAGIPCQGDGECQGTGTVPICPANICCDGICIDTLNDPANCGGCGTTCAPAESCRRGQCVALCPPDQIYCGDGCYDPLTDNTHCGDCGVDCGDLTCCGGVCIDTNADSANCGQCGSACSANATCESGQCVSPCPAGTTPCGSTCADLTSDPANCGNCGNACPADSTCTNATCVPLCPAGFTPCNGACVDIGTDPQNCGACGQICGSKACQNGTCLDGPCFVSQDGPELSFRYETESAADNLSLRTTRTVLSDDSGATLSIITRTTVSRDRQTVIRINHDYDANGAWTLTLHYGDAFEGINRAVFSGQGDSPITGKVDRRRISPFTPGADPSTLAFADGKPAPTITVDPALVDALGRIFAQAEQETSACTPIDQTNAILSPLSYGIAATAPITIYAPDMHAPTPAGAGYCDPGHHSFPPLGSAGCVACRGGCLAAGGVCGYSAAAGCSAGCALALAGYGVCLGICLAAALVACAAGELKCQNECRKPPGACCPSGCSDGCCDNGEICLDQASGLCCGGEFTKPCQGKCCCSRTDNCLPDGTCCPQGNKICNDTCCNSGETCFEGGCCAKVCDKVTPRTCCGAFDTCTECGCCPPGTTCTTDKSDRKICCPDGRLCGDVCCPNGEVCQDPRTGTCFGSTSCPPGQVACPGGTCCPTVKAQGGGTLYTCCGNVCCPSDKPYCCSPGDDTHAAVCNAVGCIR